MINRKRPRPEPTANYSATEGNTSDLGRTEAIRNVRCFTVPLLPDPGSSSAPLTGRMPVAGPWAKSAGDKAFYVVPSPADAQALTSAIEAAASIAVGATSSAQPIAFVELIGRLKEALIGASDIKHWECTQAAVRLLDESNTHTVASSSSTSAPAASPVLASVIRGEIHESGTADGSIHSKSSDRLSAGAGLPHYATSVRFELQVHLLVQQSSSAAASVLVSLCHVSSSVAYALGAVADDTVTSSSLLLARQCFERLADRLQRDTLRTGRAWRRKAAAAAAPNSMNSQL